jgi:hypothetical protein
MKKQENFSIITDTGGLRLITPPIQGGDLFVGDIVLSSVLLNCKGKMLVRIDSMLCVTE